MMRQDPAIIPEATYAGPGGTYTIHAAAPDSYITRVVLAAMGTGTAIDVTETRSERRIGDPRTPAHDATDELLR